MKGIELCILPESFSIATSD